MGKLEGAGVVIGRFQVPELHLGHLKILNMARQHQKLVVLLGVSPVPLSRDNPLDYHTREAMIHNLYPSALVAPILDRPSDELWSEDVDRLLDTYIPFTKVTLYGGRDSFIPHYSGKHRFVETPLITDTNESGTDIRNSICDEVLSTYDFRAGVIYASHNKYNSPVATVDMAVIKASKILLGNKKDSNGWRLPGGFVSPEDATYRHAAVRELAEETNLYVGVDDLALIMEGIAVNDWRKGQKIHTTLYLIAGEGRGHPTPGDDLNQVQWIDLDACLNDGFPFADDHRKLVTLVAKSLGKV